MAEIITLPWIATLPSSIESLTSLRRTTVVITLSVWVAMWIIRTASSSKIQIPRKLISSASNSVVICLIAGLDFVRIFACFFQNSHVVYKLIQREGIIAYAPTNYSKLSPELHRHHIQIHQFHTSFIVGSCIVGTWEEMHQLVKEPQTTTQLNTCHHIWLLALIKEEPHVLQICITNVLGNKDIQAGPKAYHSLWPSSHSYYISHHNNSIPYIMSHSAKGLLIVFELRVSCCEGKYSICNVIELVHIATKKLNIWLVELMYLSLFAFISWVCHHTDIHITLELCP